jgi:hypothetical protein
VFKILLLSFFAIFTEIASASLNSSMNQVGQIISILMEKSSSEARLAESSEKKKTEKQLEQLLKLFRKSKIHFNNRSANWELNHIVLTKTLEQANAAFKLNRIPMTRQLLHAVPALCISCHTQDKVKHPSISLKIPDSISELEKAEFAMATRQEGLVKDYIGAYFAQKNIKEPQEEIKAIRLELQNLIQLGASIEIVKERLELRMNMISSNEDVRKVMNDWLVGLQKAQVAFNKPIQNISDIKEILKSIYGSVNPAIGLLADPKDEIIFLKIRQSLLEILQTKKTNKELAEIFYHLALSERAVGYSIYYSLADAYLTTCMDKWPKEDGAKNCYKEYESFLEFAYSGSSGTNIPKKVQKELKMYKTKVGL